MRTPEAGKVLRRHTEEGFTDLGRVVYVCMVTKNYYWIPFPARTEKRIKHHIPAPRMEPIAVAQTTKDISFVEFDAPELQRMTEAQLLDYATATPGVRSRRDLARSIAKMNEQWEWIKDLVREHRVPELLDRKFVLAEIKRIAERHKLNGHRRVLRALQVYLAGGCTKMALLPRWDRCNERNKEKLPRPVVKGTEGPPPKTGRKNRAVLRGDLDAQGVRLDKEMREMLRAGWEKYKVSKAWTIEAAYDLTVAEYWGRNKRYSAKGELSIDLPSRTAIPTERQFRYHGPRKDGGKSASRINLGDHRFARTARGLVGTAADGVAAAAQMGYIDSTPDDQTLVSAADRTLVLGTSFNTKVVEAYTGYILGLQCGFEKPSTMTSLMAIANAASAKEDFCRRYGIELTEGEWIGLHLRHIRGDNGELKSEAGISGMNAAEVSAEFVRAYVAEHKAPVESSHHAIARASSHRMTGSTQGQPIERGDEDPRKDACYTHFEYMPHLIRAILWFNNHDRVERLLTLEMRADSVKPYRGEILKWLIRKGYVANELVDIEAIRRMCLPRLQGVINKDGVRIFDPRVTSNKRLIPGLCFWSEALDASGLTVRGRRSATPCQVSLNPSDLANAWVANTKSIPVELKTRDPLMHEVTLADWLRITDDDSLRAFVEGDGDWHARVRNSLLIERANRSSKRKTSAAKRAASERDPAKTRRQATQDEIQRQQLEALGMVHAVTAPADQSPLFGGDVDMLADDDAANDDWMDRVRESYQG